MRYHYEKPSNFIPAGERYVCNHPVYSDCTLFKIGDKGLAVIQQRYNPVSKATRWTEIDPWIAHDLYLHPAFQNFFAKRAEHPSNGLYPTVTVRQIMWALRMKPLKKERWETVFDRNDI